MILNGKLVLDPDCIDVVMDPSKGVVVSFFWTEEELRGTVIQSELVFHGKLEDLSVQNVIDYLHLKFMGEEEEE